MTSASGFMPGLGWSTHQHATSFFAGRDTTVAAGDMGWNIPASIADSAAHLLGGHRDQVAHAMALDAMKRSQATHVAAEGMFALAYGDRDGPVGDGNPSYDAASTDGDGWSTAAGDEEHIQTVTAQDPDSQLLQLGFTEEEIAAIKSTLHEGDGHYNYRYYRIPFSRFTSGAAALLGTGLDKAETTFLLLDAAQNVGSSYMTFDYLPKFIEDMVERRGLSRAQALDEIVDIVAGFEMGWLSETMTESYRALLEMGFSLEDIRRMIGGAARTSRSGNGFIDERWFYELINFAGRLRSAGVETADAVSLIDVWHRLGIETSAEGTWSLVSGIVEDMTKLGISVHMLADLLMVKADELRGCERLRNEDIQGCFYGFSKELKDGLQKLKGQGVDAGDIKAIVFGYARKFSVLDLNEYYRNIPKVFERWKADASVDDISHFTIRMLDVDSRHAGNLMYFMYAANLSHEQVFSDRSLDVARAIASNEKNKDAFYMMNTLVPSGYSFEEISSFVDDLNIIAESHGAGYFYVYYMARILLEAGTPPADVVTLTDEFSSIAARTGSSHTNTANQISHLARNGIDIRRFFKVMAAVATTLDKDTIRVLDIIDDCLILGLSDLQTATVCRAVVASLSESEYSQVASFANALKKRGYSADGIYGFILEVISVACVGRNFFGAFSAAEKLVGMGKQKAEIVELLKRSNEWTGASRKYYLSDLVVAMAGINCPMRTMRRLLYLAQKETDPDRASYAYQGIATLPIGKNSELKTPDQVYLFVRALVGLRPGDSMKVLRAANAYLHWGLNPSEVIALFRRIAGAKGVLNEADMKNIFWYEDGRRFHNDEGVEMVLRSAVQAGSLNGANLGEAVSTGVRAVRYLKDEDPNEVDWGAIRDVSQLTGELQARFFGLQRIFKLLDERHRDNLADRFIEQMAGLGHAIPETAAIAGRLHSLNLVSEVSMKTTFALIGRGMDIEAIIKMAEGVSRYVQSDDMPRCYEAVLGIMEAGCTAEQVMQIVSHVASADGLGDPAEALKSFAKLVKKSMAARDTLIYFDVIQNLPGSRGMIDYVIFADMVEMGVTPDRALVMLGAASASGWHYEGARKALLKSLKSEVGTSPAFIEFVNKFGFNRILAILLNDRSTTGAERARIVELVRGKIAESWAGILRGRDPDELPRVFEFSARIMAEKAEYTYRRISAIAEATKKPTITVYILRTAYKLDVERLEDQFLEDGIPLAEARNRVFEFRKAVIERTKGGMQRMEAELAVAKEWLADGRFKRFTHSVKLKVPSGGNPSNNVSEQIRGLSRLAERENYDIVFIDHSTVRTEGVVHRGDVVEANKGRALSRALEIVDPEQRYRKWMYKVNGWEMPTLDRDRPNMVALNLYDGRIYEAHTGGVKTDWLPVDDHDELVGVRWDNGGEGSIHRSDYIVIKRNAEGEYSVTSANSLFNDYFSRHLQRLRSGSERMPIPFRNILFVCNANHDRSPLAEHLMRNLVADTVSNPEGVRVWSAGIATDDWLLEKGEKKESPLIPSSGTRGLLDQAGIDYSGFQKHQLTAEDMKASDIIFVMTDRQRGVLLDRYPEFAGKIHVLRKYAGYDEKDRDIPTPRTFNYQTRYSFQEALERALQKMSGRALRPARAIPKRPFRGAASYYAVNP